MNDIVIEKLAIFFHEQWKEEKIEQGFHLPKFCENYEKKINENGEVIDENLIHCNKCSTFLVDYQDLDDYKKLEYFNNSKIFLNKLNNFGLDIILISNKT